MKHLRINHYKCRIIFFDLEFYVPESSRVEHGLCYNPWDKSCKLLGGAFLIANPGSDFDVTDKYLDSKTKSLWLWQHNSERDLLLKVYQILKKAEETVSNAHDNRLSPLLCGIGISSSDTPILFELFKRYQILSNIEAFKLQSRFRSIDLSQLAITMFNNSNHFLYPKTKNVILNKYFRDVKFDKSESVWELYENNDFKSIESRTRDEVFYTHKCYEKIYADILKFKNLEKYDIRRKKLALKNENEDNELTTIRLAG